MTARATAADFAAGATVVHETRDGVMSITINRPTRRNALTFDMYLALADLLTNAAEHEDVHAVLLHGSGDYFTAGNDLSDFIGYQADDEFVPIHFLRAISTCPKPVVAAVEGGAIGVGATLLLHCDAAYAGRSTRFLMPFVNLGLCAEGASSLLLPRNAGYKQAVRWLMLAEPFDADAARDAGLITAVVDDGLALNAARETAARFASLPADAVRTTKALMRADQTEQVQAVIDSECDAFARMLAAPRAQAALTAFVNKSASQKQREGADNSSRR